MRRHTSAEQALRVLTGKRSLLFSHIVLPSAEGVRFGWSSLPLPARLPRVGDIDPWNGHRVVAVVVPCPYRVPDFSRRRIEYADRSAREVLLAEEAPNG